MAASDVLYVTKRPATEEELEQALTRILSSRGVYDGEEIARILQVPAFGFELKPPEGQFTCFALLTRIFRGNPNLELGLVRSGGKIKLAILNHHVP